MHKVIEDYQKNCTQEPSSIEIQMEVQRTFQEIWEQIPVFEREEKIKTCISHYINNERKRLPHEKGFANKGTHLEQHFEYGIYHGYVDWYNQYSGIIRDWKTSKSDKLDKSMQIQGIVNKYLLENNGFKVTKVIFEMLFEGTSQPLPPLIDSFHDNQMKEIQIACQTGNFPKKPSGLCDYCPYQIRCENDQKSFWSPL